MKDARATGLLRDLPPIVCGDEKQTRDFVYVEGVVEAKMCALNSKNAVGDVLNVGRGSRVSVNNIAETLKELLNKQDLKNIHVDRRSGDVKHGYANISKA